MFAEAAASMISVLQTFESCNRFNLPDRVLLQSRRPQFAGVGYTLSCSFEDVFRLRPAQVALDPFYLVQRGRRSFPRSGIAKFVVNVCSPDTNKNTNKTDGCSEYTSADVLKNALKFRFAAAKFYVCFQCAAKKSRNRTNDVSYCYCWLFQSGAPGRNRTSTPCGTRF